MEGTAPGGWKVCALNSTTCPHCFLPKPGEGTVCLPVDKKTRDMTTCPRGYDKHHSGGEAV